MGAIRHDRAESVIDEAARGWCGAAWNYLRMVKMHALEGSSQFDCDGVAG